MCADWDNDRDTDKMDRLRREAIWISKCNDMIQDEGSYQLRQVTDIRNQKSVRMKTSDWRSKCFWLCKGK